MPTPTVTPSPIVKAVIGTYTPSTATPPHPHPEAVDAKITATHAHGNPLAGAHATGTLSSPVYVYVTDFPKADAWIIGQTILAIVATVAAVGALIAAVRTYMLGQVTLGRINEQIRLANEQLEIARQQLAQVDTQIGLSRLELALVNEDLETNRAQMKEFLRKASIRLICSVATSPAPKQGYPGVFIEDAQQLHTKVNVTNTGSKIARSVILELLIPCDLFATPPTTYKTIPNKGNYAERKFSWGQVILYPNDTVPGQTYEDISVIRLDRTNATFLWRAYDEFDAYAWSGRESHW